MQFISNIVKDKISLENVALLGFTADQYRNIINLIGRKPNFLELKTIAKSFFYSQSDKYYLNISNALSTIKDNNKTINIDNLEFEITSDILDVGNFSSRNELRLLVENYINSVIIKRSLGVTILGIDYEITVGNFKTRDLYIDTIIDVIANFHQYLSVPAITNNISRIFHSKIYIKVNCLISKKNLLLNDLKDNMSIVYFGNKVGREGSKNLLTAYGQNDKNYFNKPRIDLFNTKISIDLLKELSNKNIFERILYLEDNGIAPSVLNMLKDSNYGSVIDIKNIPLRESGMSADEIILSQSAGGFLAIVDDSKFFTEEINNIFKKWNLEFYKIGSLSNNKLINFFFDPYFYISIPNNILSNIESNILNEENIVENKPFNIERLKDLDLMDSWMQLLSMPIFDNNEKYKNKIDNYAGGYVIENCSKYTRMHISPQSDVIYIADNHMIKYSNIHNIGFYIIDMYQKILCKGADCKSININVIGNLKTYSKLLNIVSTSFGNLVTDLKIPINNINFYHSNNFDDIIVYISGIGLANHSIDSILKDIKTTSNLAIIRHKDSLANLSGSFLDQIMLASTSNFVPSNGYAQLDNFNILKDISNVIKSGLVSFTSSIGKGGILKELNRFLLKRNKGIKMDLNIDEKEMIKFLFEEGVGRLLIAYENEEQLLEIKSKLANDNIIIENIGTITDEKVIEINKDIKFDIDSVSGLTYKNC